ncbi:MAG: cupin domain-containing protein [Chitinophagaceae bacterium]
MRRLIFLICFFLPCLVWGQTNVLPSGMYGWKTPKTKAGKNILSAVLFSGEVTDMSYLQMSANTLQRSKQPTALKVPGNEEYLLLVKNGLLTLSFGDSTWKIGGGSVAVLVPGQIFKVQNTLGGECSYYLMKYRSKLPPSKDAAGSLVRDWNKLPFNKHERGGVRRYFDRQTPMCKKLAMHVTTLNEGLKSHDAHMHRDDEIILVISNKTEMQIGNSYHKGGTGDIYYLASNVPHAIQNIGKDSAVYFAFHFQ